ncbi:MAG: DUF2264 domain-containing protein [Lachnospiraceae bacterium]|nr:DUF2264 domain-containing protein [Lachnospiraceae bacterium]
MSGNFIDLEYTDHELSPYTGLTRESYKAIGRKLLSGIFDHIKSIEDPVIVKRSETEITYPHKDAKGGVLDAENRAEMFEGLTRSLFLASVLIYEDPDLTLNGINVRDYYKLHILRSCTDKSSREYAGSYEEMLKNTGSTDSFRPFQQTVETAALVIGLYVCKDVLWDTYEKDEKDGIAAFLSGFAHANTVPQNWRFFNLLDLAFLYMNGYEIDEYIMADHAKECLNYYVGDGWYRDGHSFDYYSCWAFSFYAPLWNLWYGYEHMPDIAKRFEENSNKLMETFPDMFDEEGHMNMWGRSCIYRNAVTSAFDGNLFLKDPALDAGIARRIASGAMLQFIKREEFLKEGVPSLGFYGQFAPLIQGYSCAESVFWIFKSFLCLKLPKDHPFWTEKENNGTWEKLGPLETKETVLDGPALVFTNHKANGTTILRTGKVVKNKGDMHGMLNYSKLCYNTAFPWEADARSCQYELVSLVDGHRESANVTFYSGVSDGVLYRRQFFDYDLTNECHWLEAADLCDYAVPLGIMRADRLRVAKRPKEIYLGSYGFADRGNLKTVKITGNTVPLCCEGEKEKTEITPVSYVIYGTDHEGRKRGMAMTVYTGFSDIETVRNHGKNPEAENSVMILAKGGLYRQYDGSECTVYISQLITINEDREFKNEELFPIRMIKADTDISKTRNPGLAGELSIEHNDGRCVRIRIGSLEGKMML